MVQTCLRSVQACPRRGKKRKEGSQREEAKAGRGERAEKTRGEGAGREESRKQRQGAEAGSREREEAERGRKRGGEGGREKETSSSVVEPRPLVLLALDPLARLRAASLPCLGLLRASSHRRPELAFAACIARRRRERR
eukprot:505777-Rhodomonas_salina.1